MLRFELLSDGGAGKFVKLYFESQSYSQQRGATALGAELGEVHKDLCSCCSLIS